MLWSRRRLSSCTLSTCFRSEMISPSTVTRRSRIPVLPSCSSRAGRNHERGLVNLLRKIHPSHGVLEAGVEAESVSSARRRQLTRVDSRGSAIILPYSYQTKVFQKSSAWLGFWRAVDHKLRKKPQLLFDEGLVPQFFSTTQMLRNRTGFPWSCRKSGPGWLSLVIFPSSSGGTGGRTNFS